MSYNGSGTFQINSSGQPVVTGTVISSTAFNALTADLATGLSTAITKDGQTTTTSRILFAQGISSTLVTDATSSTTGSIITAGGISCQKALFVGSATNSNGQTSGAVVITGGLGVGGDLYAGQTLVTNAAAGTSRRHYFQSTASNRFNLGISGEAESGSNAGSNFVITRYTDAGVVIDNPLNITRSTGSVIMAGGINSTAIGATTASTGRFTTVTTTGAVGIGMTPTNVLDITQNQNNLSTVSILNNDAGTTAQARFQATNGTSVGLFGTTGQNFTPAAIFSGGDTYVIAQGNNLDLVAAAAIKFAVNNTSAEIARIDTSGNLLVGTTGVTGGLNGKVINVFGSSTVRNIVQTTGQYAVVNLGSGGTSASPTTTGFLLTDGTANTYVIGTGTNTPVNVISNSSGGVTLTSGSTAWAAISDETLKTDLATIQSGAEKVGSLRAVTGRYKTDAESMSRSFLIAQDVQKVLPEAVSTDADGTLSLRYTEVIPLMVAAIQELTTRLAALENK